MLRQHPQVPSVYAAPTQQGIFVQCTACNVKGYLQPGATVDGFAAQHQHYYGAGDVVTGVTGALGVKPCTPCEARRQAMNRWLPKVWRR